MVKLTVCVKTAVLLSGDESAPLPLYGPGICGLANGIRTGFDVTSGCGVNVELGVAVAVDDGEALGDAVAVDDGEALGDAVAVGLGDDVALGVGVSVGLGDGVAVALGSNVAVAVAADVIGRCARRRIAEGATWRVWLWWPGRGRSVGARRGRARGMTVVSVAEGPTSVDAAVVAVGG